MKLRMISQQSVLIVFSLNVLKCSGFDEKYPSCPAEDKDQNCQAQNDGQNTKSQMMHSEKTNGETSWKLFIEAHQKAVELYEGGIKKQEQRFPYTSTIENDLAIFKKNGIR